MQWSQDRTCLSKDLFIIEMPNKKDMLPNRQHTCFSNMDLACFFSLLLQKIASAYCFSLFLQLLVHVLKLLCSPAASADTEGDNECSCKSSGDAQEQDEDDVLRDAQL